MSIYGATVVAARKNGGWRPTDPYLLLMLVVVMNGCSKVQSLFRLSLKTRDVGRTDGGKSNGNLCRAVVEALSVVVAILVLVVAMPGRGLDDGGA